MKGLAVVLVLAYVITCVLAAAYNGKIKSPGVASLKGARPVLSLLGRKTPQLATLIFAD